MKYLIEDELGMFTECNDIEQIETAHKQYRLYGKDDFGMTTIVSPEEDLEINRENR